MGTVVNVNEVLADHVRLDVECVDRLYLNGYVPNLQVGGQVVRFLCEHLGSPIPSGAIMERIGERFRGDVQRFAARRRIPLVRFGKSERKIERMMALLSRAASPGGVAIGQAQEFQWVATSYRRATSTPQSAPRGGAELPGPPAQVGDRPPPWCFINPEDGFVGSVGDPVVSRPPPTKR
jgi:hypothetical protein